MRHFHVFAMAADTEDSRCWECGEEGNAVEYLICADCDIIVCAACVHQPEASDQAIHAMVASYIKAAS